MLFKMWHMVQVYLLSSCLLNKCFLDVILFTISAKIIWFQGTIAGNRKSQHNKYNWYIIHDFYIHRVHVRWIKCQENVIHHASAHGVLPSKSVTDLACARWIIVQ